MISTTVIPGIAEGGELGEKENSSSDFEENSKQNNIYPNGKYTAATQSTHDNITLATASNKNNSSNKYSDSYMSDDHVSHVSTRKSVRSTGNAIEDKEADLKNISFLGIPNSVLNQNNNNSTYSYDTRPNIPSNKDSSVSPRTSVSRNFNSIIHPGIIRQNNYANQSMNNLVEANASDPNDPVRSENSQRRKSYIGPSDQNKFNSWRKEFNTAFKKISVVSKLKTMRNVRRSGVRHQTSADQILMDEDKHTQQIASDLISSLLAGGPAALFASTYFLRDEHGYRRAPLLLAMLDLRIKPIDDISKYLNGGKFTNFLDNNPNPNNIDISLSRRSSLLSFSSLVLQDNQDNQTSNRSGGNANMHDDQSTRNNRAINYHNLKTQIFEIEFEYGIGDDRYSWSILKSYSNMLQLHHNLKIVSFQQNTVKKLYIDENRFHKFQLPYFPGLKVHKDREHSEKLNRPTSSISSVSSSSSDCSLNAIQSPSSTIFNIDQIKMKHLQDLIDESDDVSQPMHIRLERYFRLLNLALCLRPQANRLFHFYEFSPMGNLLSYENGYQGKEGYLLIRSTAKTQGWRVSHFNFHDFKEMIERHTPKWFLVRDSYVTYTSSLCSTTPLDVFMVDSHFKIKCSGKIKRKKNTREKRWSNDRKNTFYNSESSDEELDWDLENSKKISTNLLITLENSERKLQMICKSEVSMKLWVSSFTLMARNTIWSRKHRFSSFAPVRTNSFAKFLVDGRDYFWALSEAFEMAEDVIYIHDWWLSPELYLRRPVNGNQEFRVDRVLKRCAERGVKVFIVVYRNVGTTVGTDSLWTKHSMLGLHPNIHLIRSPNQWLQNTYFWAHHEKLTVIDNTIAFMGGIDLCYGRYDTPEHVLRDDFPDIKDQTFPGKDYSNARVCDFFELDKPFESMYDREEVPRMPWHDVHMMTVGETARDMARHFVQRWNYLLREKRPSRPTPLLLPPTDFTKEELENSPFFRSLKSKSTCELQVLRSAGNWSLGLKETEKSIQNAYLKLIESSNHYIYIENQFFVTSSEWDGVIIENKIGDAIVDRIIRANSEGTNWKAFIIIPLMPGFDSPIDQPEASSLRVIMQCQFQSISRGDTSIFARLKKLNIDPMQYIRFFSLRKWSTIGPYEKLVSEQLYVHAKLLIVDDRSCIIGSANINERSQLGNRDSEVAIVVRDTDLVKTKMNDKEYYAGRFAWELRQRLMREHLGCDVDLVEIVERKFGRLENIAKLNYSTLNTIPIVENIKPNKKSMMFSSMIELSYREVFDCEYSPQWFEKFGNHINIVSAHYGVLILDNSDIPDTTNKHQENDIGDASSVLDSLEIPTKKAKLPHLHFDKDKKPTLHTFNYRAGVDNIGIRDNKPISSDPRLINNDLHRNEVSGNSPDGWNNVTHVFKESVTEQLQEWALKSMSLRMDGKDVKEPRNNFLPTREDIAQYIDSDTIKTDKKWDMMKRVCYLQYLTQKIVDNEYSRPKFNQKSKTLSKFNDTDTEKLHNDHADLLEEQELDDETLDILLSQLAPTLAKSGVSQDISSKFLNLKFIDPYSLDDPLSPTFVEETWFVIAMRNTLLYRLVFHCQPDNAVQTWRDYKDFKRMSEAFVDSQNELINLEIKEEKDTSNQLDGQIDNLNNSNGDTLHNSNNNISEFSGANISNPAELQKEKHVPTQKTENDENKNINHGDGKRNRALNLQMKLGGSILYGFNKRIFDKYTARRILERIHGNLVLFPTEWLGREVESKNWFYNADRLPPIDIYD